MRTGTVRRLVLALIALAATAGGVYYAVQPGEALQKPAKREAPAAPVRIAESTVRTIPVRLETIGTVQPRSTVSIRSRVDGQIMEAAFEEGHIVRKGDLLFQIDPRTFHAKLRQAEANLARDIAQLEKAKGDLDRYQALSTKGFSSQQKYEEARATVAALEATVRGEEAAVEMARLELEFTTIRAPVSGRTGNLLVHPGNLVKANDDPALVVINETQPIHVSFSVPEQYLPEIKQRMAAGTLSALVTIPEDSGPPEQGQVTFINNLVDVTTGTIQLKATFPNEDNRLMPGQFVSVSLILSSIVDAVAVPSPAVQIGQNGTFVFVVKKDKTVEPRPVVTGPTADDMTVITSGLEAGETVVTEGQLRLYPGARVAPRNEAPDGRASPVS